MRLSGCENPTSVSHDAFSRVSGLTSRPSSAARKISAGAVSDDFANTTNPGPGRAAEIAPPCTAAFGTPPAAGTTNRFSRPACPAVNQIDPAAVTE